MARHVNDVLKTMVIDLFDRVEKTQGEKRAERIAARNREMPKICKLLDIEYQSMKEDAA